MALTMTNDRLEAAWKWVLRALGIVGFIYLITAKPDAPVAFYVLLAGLLGLPNVIAYQIALNRSEATDDAHKDEHGYVP